MDAARLALAVSPPDGPIDPIEHAVQWWPELQLDEASIEVLIDALIARAATAHLEYLRLPNEQNAILARQEYELVLDVLARIETSSDPRP